jgi:hypothetical protein
MTARRQIAICFILIAAVVSATAGHAAAADNKTSGGPLGPVALQSFRRVAMF